MYIFIRYIGYRIILQVRTSQIKGKNKGLKQNNIKFQIYILQRCYLAQHNSVCTITLKLSETFLALNKNKTI